MTIGNEKRCPGRGCHVGVRPGPGRRASHDFPAWWPPCRHRRC